jgi:hypothetical protein
MDVFCRFHFASWGSTRLAPNHGAAGLPLHGRIASHLAPQRRRLTSRSRGSSNGVPPGPEARYGVHFLSSGPGVPPLLFPLAPTLGSTFRHCGLQASQFKCSLRQSLVQYRSWCLPFVALAKVVAKPTTRPVTNAALTSFGVCEPRRLLAYSPNSATSCRRLFTSQLTQAREPRLCGRVSRHRRARLSVTRQVLAFSGWLSGAARASRFSVRVRLNSGGSRSRFPYSCAMSPRSAVLPNPSVKRSANIASRWPSSAGAAPHFALAVQRATPLATAYLKR